MIHWHIGHQAYRHYFENREGFVTGTAFLGNRMLQGETLLKHIQTWDCPEEWKEGLLALNGFFTVVLKRGNRVFAAVDRLRSIPLFYGKRETGIFISDDARWVRDKLEDQKLDPMAKQEFLATGYVTGPDTLFPKVKQIQAGEFILFQTSEDGHSDVFPQQYFRYVHSNYSNSPEQILHHRLQYTLEEIFKRLITFANRRTIVVPLSGGFDSRLIVLMLKELGYENVIAFSYGKAGNKESEVSKKVADTLGFRWEFVPYTNELWYRWYRAPEMQEYFLFADGLSSLPHIQDWPAVWELKRGKTIPEDSIFVPGHSADLPAGSRSSSVPDLYSQRVTVTEDGLIEAILGYHYNLCEWWKKEEELPTQFKNKILKKCELLSQYPDPSSAFESWDIAERQPKFIVNSLRVYDFFGYEWWMPFWDKSFIEFWQNIPPELRINQTLYIKYINKLSQSYSIKFNKNASEYPMIQNWLMTLAKKILPHNIKQYLRKRRHAKAFSNHPLQWYGICDLTSITKKILDGNISINSILVQDVVANLDKNRHEGKVSCRIFL